MRVLAIDYSTHAGWAVFDDGKLIAYGTLHLGQGIKDFGAYPWNYPSCARAQAEKIGNEVIAKWNPDHVVIEETNGSKNRYTQKLLEFLHFALLMWLAGRRADVVYVNTNDWRSNLGIWLTKEQKKANAKLARAKRAAEEKGVPLDRKALGIRGKVTRKHAAVNYVNERFGLSLRQKDNDAAEAICIGLAFLNGVAMCNGE